ILITQKGLKSIADEGLKSIADDKKMMMKSLLSQQQNPGVEENMSNLTSASGEASVSSGNIRAESGSIFPHQYFAPNQTQQAVKKKRNLPGNPDPDAEVISLSPKSLMATNRFICEICSKGFQRDQNLQLHRRGHNLPWKLKQRSSKEIKKKVYVCPEPSCVHHHPSRALGDLTGIKKHFCRKHGEKKWKCEKCSKRYAVQSDWKAHSKTCGTREYRCDCGTLFSRRDSFITHRAFCDALAEESARATIPGVNPLLSSTQSPISHINPQNIQFQPQFLQSFQMKQEQQSFNGILPRPDIPPWLSCPPPAVGSGPGPPPPTLFSATTRLDHQDLITNHQDFENPISPNSSTTLQVQPYQHQPMASPHMSATALLQKAAQMGATMSTANKNCSAGHGPHQGQDHHVSADSSGNYMITTAAAAGFGQNLASREGMGTGFFFPFGDSNKAQLNLSGTEAGSGAGGAGGGAAAPSSSFLQDMISISSASGFAGSSFDDTFGGMLSSKKDGSGGGGNEGMTRDFLGLRPLSESDILSIAGLSNHVSNQNQTQKSWQGN
ncbi:hypothetical protein C3L33_00162, partial [Rhododendron williamsianum]